MIPSHHCGSTASEPRAYNQFQEKKIETFSSKHSSSRERFFLCLLFLGAHEASLLMNRQLQLSVYSWQLRLKLHTFYCRPHPLPCISPPWPRCRPPPATPVTSRLCTATLGTTRFLGSSPNLPAPVPRAGHLSPDQTVSIWI